MPEYTASRPVRAPPENVIRLASSPRVFIAMWPYVREFECTGEGPRVVFVFKRFGLSTRAEYTLEVKTGPTSVEYRGESGKRRFRLLVEAEPTGEGSRVKVTVTYEGPYESFAEPIVRKFAEEVASKLAAAAEAGEARHDLSDAAYVANLLARGRLLLTREVVLATVADVQALIRNLAALSSGRRVFARLTSGRKCARLLFENGEIIDAVLEDNGVVRGPRVVEELLDKLRGERVELLAIEA